MFDSLRRVSRALWSRPGLYGPLRVLLLMLLLSVFGAVSSFAQKKPNVLFIILDDVNDWVGAMGGHPGVETPQIDRLADQGVLFTNAHAQAPVCVPSRISFLTGLLPSTTGIYNNQQLHMRDLLPDVVTVFDYFRMHGYAIYGGGKVFHGTNTDEIWDEYHRSDDSPESEVKPANGIDGLAEELDWAALEIPDTEMSDYKMASWAVEKLGEQYERPFFLSVGFKRPHGPWYTPKANYDQYPVENIVLPIVPEDDLLDLPVRAQQIPLQQEYEAIKASGKWAEAVRAYMASLSFVDEQVGRVLDALEGSPYAENTIIVLASDHGYHLGEKHHWRKYTLWEESTRVPLIIAAPGVMPGRRSARTVSLTDLYPTLVDLADLPPKDSVDGVSLTPLLEDPAAPWEQAALTARKTGGGRDGPHFSVRTERWRYIVYSHGQGDELYDHQVDPNEWNNLAQDLAYVDVIESLRQHLPPIFEKEIPSTQLAVWLRSDAGITTNLEGEPVGLWSDQSGRGYDASASELAAQPSFRADGINTQPSVRFDGADDLLVLTGGGEVNGGGPYTGKTLMLVFKTDSDITTRQVLYEQGGIGRGLNLYIDQGRVYAGVWNLSNDDELSPWGPVFHSTAVAPGMSYVVMLHYDQIADRVTGYINGYVFGMTQGGTGRLYRHDVAVLGGRRGTSHFHDGTAGEGLAGSFFRGELGELVLYNAAVSERDRREVEQYLGLRWAVSLAGVGEEGQKDVPGSTVELSAPAPNPFQHTTSFSMTVDHPQPVRVEVFDALGRRMSVLWDAPMVPGQPYRLQIDAEGYPSGLYFYRASGTSFVKTGKVLLVR